MNISRRQFLAGTAAAAATVSTRHVFAAPSLTLPLGLELWSVHNEIQTDVEGVLNKIGSLGYKEVEAADLPQKPAKEIRAALDHAGLRCVSSHRGLEELTGDNLEKTVAYDKALGVQNIICPGPGKRNPNGSENLTLDDWHYTAEQLNTIATKCKPMGVQIGYHNHYMEFLPVEDAIPFSELMRICDPKIVTFELDCGWVVFSGSDPIEVFKKYPHRISMLHVKDFKFKGDPAAKPREGNAVELGRGTIDYKPIFAAAAKTQSIKHIFVEQEAFTVPWLDSLKIDADYMRKDVKATV